MGEQVLAEPLYGLRWALLAKTHQRLRKRRRERPERFLHSASENHGLVARSYRPLSRKKRFSLRVCLGTYCIDTDVPTVDMSFRV